MHSANKVTDASFADLDVILTRGDVVRFAAHAVNYAAVLPIAPLLLEVARA